jgi:hypothetical protein
VRFVAGGTGLVPALFEAVAIEEVSEEISDPSAQAEFEELFEDPFGGDDVPPLSPGPLGHAGALALPEEGFSAACWEGFREAA